MYGTHPNRVCQPHSGGDGRENVNLASKRPRTLATRMNCKADIVVTTRRSFEEVCLPPILQGRVGESLIDLRRPKGEDSD